MAHAQVLAVVLVAIALAAPISAQAEPGESSDDLASRVAKLEAEISTLTRRQADIDKEAADRELRSRNLVNLYGDIGVAWHMLFEGKTETFNRPEFRLHLGVYGTALEQDRQQIRYDMRLTTVAEDLNGKPTPTLSWLPFPGYGINPQLAVDRFSVEYDYDRLFSMTIGRFPSPFVGSEMLFDQDYHFQGLTQTVRLERLFSDSTRMAIPRLAFTGVQGYMAQNNIGLPQPTAESQPIYIGAQFQFELAPWDRPSEGDTPAQTGLAFGLALGIHWFDGEEGIASNLGIGYLEDTTNVLAADGLVQSEFLIGELYLSVTLARFGRASAVVWGHGLLNFHAEPQVEGRAERNDSAVQGGLMFGMERLSRAWDFNIGVRYFLVEADALIPEFNSETMNTNIKGWHAELQVRVFPTITAFGTATLSERENFELNGFGLPNRGNPSRASGQSFRARIGLFLEF